MAFARDTYTASASQTDFTITFPYIANTDIDVYVDGTLKTVTTDYTFPDTTTVRFGAGLVGGEVVLVTRTTSQATRLVTYTAGSLLTNDLNNDSLQAFYMAQEAIDTTLASMNLNAAEHWDAETKLINLVVDPVSDQDAATKKYVDDSVTTAATGTLGSPVSVANGGTASATASAARTSLGVAIGSDVQAYDATILTDSDIGSSVQAYSASILTTSDVNQHPNLVINGNFNVWQRGTSFTGVTTGDFTADRWSIGYSAGTLVMDMKQEVTSLPDGTSDIALSVDVTTAESAIAAGEYAAVIQSIEGYNAVQLGNGHTDAKTFTLSFWVYSTKTGIHCVAFRNSAADRSYVAEYTVSVTNTWEKKTITLTGDTVGVAGDWLTTNGIGLTLVFTLACGSDFHGTVDTWEAANDLATSSQVNSVDNAANFWRISQVQLEVGSVATPFQREDYATTLGKCRRYFQRIGSSGGTTIATGYASSTTNAQVFMQISPPMRSTPTLVVSNVADFHVVESGGTGNNTTNVVLAATVSDQFSTAILSATTTGIVAGEGVRLSFDAGGARTLDLVAEI